MIMTQFSLSLFVQVKEKKTLFVHLIDSLRSHFVHISVNKVIFLVLVQFFVFFLISCDLEITDRKFPAPTACFWVRNDRR